ncbi:MAG: hypothetical protein ACTSXL_02365 [Alphaproteobacteria bacterium]
MKSKNDYLLLQDEIKALYTEELSNDEVQDSMSNLVGFFTELIEADLENRRENRFSVASSYNSDGTRKEKTE